jgi:hypothetical protein
MLDITVINDLFTATTDVITANIEHIVQVYEYMGQFIADKTQYLVFGGVIQPDGTVFCDVASDPVTNAVDLSKCIGNSTGIIGLPLSTDWNPLFPWLA